MLLTYDDVSDALYVSLRDGVNVDRTEQIDAGTLVDVDRAGEIVGIEVLRPARAWPLDEIVDRYHIGDPDVTLLRSVFQRPAHDQHPFPFARPVRIKAS